MDVRETANIGNLCGGAIPEVFDRTLEQVINMWISNGNHYRKLQKRHGVAAEAPRRYA